MHPWLERQENNKFIIASIEFKETTKSNEENNKKKRKEMKEEKKQKKKKKSKKSSEQKLIEYLVDTGTIKRRDEEEGGDTKLGDDYTKKSEQSIRLWFTNPCGTGLAHKNSNSHACLKFIKLKSKADLVGIAETNLNWKLLSNNSCLIIIRIYILSGTIIISHRREFNVHLPHVEAGGAYCVVGTIGPYVSFWY